MCAVGALHMGPNTHWGFSSGSASLPRQLKHITQCVTNNSYVFYNKTVKLQTVEGWTVTRALCYCLLLYYGNMICMTLCCDWTVVELLYHGTHCSCHPVSGKV